MADEFKEVTTTSWGQRITSSFAGIIIGVILFIASFPLIFWNEGRSVDRIKTLDEGRGMVVSVGSDQVDPANNGKLIHTTGNATTDETLDDQLFGVSVNALKLKRTVEMYQWKQNESSKSSQNMGGSETTETTYTYEKVWDESLINSSGFKKAGHDNPSDMPYSSESFQASLITLGAFNLSGPFVDQISEYQNYPLTEANEEAMDPDLKQYFVRKGGQYYYGNDMNNPQIGDIRVTYGIIKPGEMSAVGKQDGGSIQPYYTNNGTISLLGVGDQSAEAMFKTAASENSFFTWILRLAAFMMMWIGLTMFFAPIRILGAVVPMIGDILGAGIGLVSFLVALVLTFVTVALAWLFFRPLIGIVLLIIAGAALYFGAKKLKERAAKNPSAATAA